jgi:maltooligosyltrehalose synthase
MPGRKVTDPAAIAAERESLDRLRHQLRRRGFGPLLDALADQACLKPCGRPRWQSVRVKLKKSRWAFDHHLAECRLLVGVIQSR